MPLDGRTVPVPLSREAILDASAPIASRLLTFVTDFISRHSVQLRHVALAGNGFKLRGLKDVIAHEIARSMPEAQLHDTLPLGEVVARGCATFASMLASETIELDASDLRHRNMHSHHEGSHARDRSHILPVPLPSFAETFFQSEPWSSRSTA